MNNKLTELIDYLTKLDSAVLALSGGLDSVLLAKALSMSGIRTLAITGRSETTPPRDLADAIRHAKEFGLEHRVIESMELRSLEFVSNTPHRCYHCKDALFGQLTEIARAEDYACVMDGGNMDDTDDYRPGRRAATEHGVLSPLIECGFTKQDIREAASSLGLEIAQKPASPCLSSRFAYGVTITPEALIRVSRAEDYVRELLDINELRVRDMGGKASVEVPANEVMRLMSMRARVIEKLKILGYSSIEIDIDGFKSGKMNQVLKNAQGHHE